jgi:DNA polymerase III subunit chi
LECWFYHLERSDVAAAVPPLVEKCLQRGWHAIVRSPVPERLEALDTLLWSWKPDSWLPHGRSGGDHDARQPVLLTDGPGNPNGAQALFRLDGADEGDVTGIARAFVLFDGRDPDALARARDDWRIARAAGHDLAYWRQTGESGWQRQDQG